MSKGIEGIEPHRLQVPAMDRPSIAFAWFLDALHVRQPSDSDALVLACGVCNEHICEIEATDTLRVLLNTALAHTCEVK